MLFRNKLKLLLENDSKQLIVVDIQPEYEKSLSFGIENFCFWLNEKFEEFNNVLFLYNGPELGMSDQNKIQQWFFENGLDEKVINLSDWYDKSYAFFRYCIDSGIDDEDIATLVKYMDEHDITDSRDIDEDIWKKFLEEYPLEEVKELLYDSSDMINLPDLMDELKRLNNSDIILVGGSSDACLKEVEIALMAINRSFTRMDKWIYDG